MDPPLDAKPPPHLPLLKLTHTTHPLGCRSSLSVVIYKAVMLALVHL